MAENVCLLDGTRPVDVPIVADDHPLIHHNDLLAHLFDALSKSQGMVALTISPSKDNTISALLKNTFPAIKSTNDLPTPWISPSTIAYIHGLIIDSVTALQTDSVTTRAFRCETMARQELESMTLAEFHDELRLALTSYYEGIVKMEGASCVVLKVAYKRPIKRLSAIQDPPPPANDAADDPAAAAPAAPAAAAAASPAKPQRAAGKKTK